MQAAGEDEQPPGAPTSPTQPRIQARSKDKAPGGLNAHHDDRQAAGLLQAPGGDDLRNILHSGQHGSQQAEEVCPAADVRGEGVDKDNGADEGDDEEAERDGEHEDGFFPRGYGGRVGVFGVLVDAGDRGAREEDEEEEHAGRCE